MRESKEDKRRATARALVSKIEQETGQCADPVEFMLRIVANEEAPYVDRVECAKAAAPYVHPKLANVQHTGANGNPIEHRVIHELMMDPRTAELAEQLSFALVRKTNQIEAINPVTTIDLSPSDDEPEVFVADPRPPADIEAALDERLSSPDSTPLNAAPEPKAA